MKLNWTLAFLASETEDWNNALILEELQFLRSTEEPKQDSQQMTDPATQRNAWIVRYPSFLVG